MVTAADLNADMTRVCASLVRRARSGDQNAQGMIGSVVKAAGEPNANFRTKLAKRVLGDYLKAHPVGESDMGADAVLPPPPPLTKETLAATRKPESFPKACGLAHLHPLGPYAVVVVLVFGPPLSASRLEAYGNALHAGDVPPAVIQAGADVLAQARSIQAVRSGAPVATLCPRVAWELGE